MQQDQKRKGKIQFSRRHVLSLAATGAAGAAIATLPYPAPLFAETANVHKTKIGDFKVSVFSDGKLSLPVSRMLGDASPAERKAILKAPGHTADQIPMPLNVSLIRTPKELILIDSGTGPGFTSSSGRLSEVMEENGVDMEKITKVLFTHAHPDHLWGIINDFDELSFPNAQYILSEAEWNYWTASDLLSKLPDTRQSSGIGAQRRLATVKEMIKTIKPGDEIISGLRAFDTAGHTPGHLSYEIASKSDRLMIIGDALLHPVVSFQHPAWRGDVDTDPDQAVRTRKPNIFSPKQSGITGQRVTF